MTPDELKTLIDNARNEGIKLVLDLLKDEDRRTLLTGPGWASIMVLRIEKLMGWKNAEAKTND